MSELLEPTLLTGEGEGAPPWAISCVGLGCLGAARPPVSGGGGVAECHLPPALSCILPLVSQVVTT